MQTIKTNIEGVVLFEPSIHGDARGYFYESWREDEFAAAIGCDVHFVQENQSRSSRGVVRGLHFQRPPHAQAKLVRVVEGCVLDVVVDLRVGSPTYGKYLALELSAENHRQLFVPSGFAHGYAVLSPSATFMYKCDNYYAPQSEGGIAWDDPDLAIDWQIDLAELNLSVKDLCHPRLADFESPFTL